MWSVVKQIIGGLLLVSAYGIEKKDIATNKYMNDVLRMKTYP